MSDNTTLFILLHLLLHHPVLVTPHYVEPLLVLHWGA